MFFVCLYQDCVIAVDILNFPGVALIFADYMVEIPINFCGLTFLVQSWSKQYFDSKTF